MLRVAAIVIVSTTCLACTAERPAPPKPTPSVTSPAVTPASERAVHTATNLPDGDVLVVGGCVSDGCTTATASALIVDPGGAVRTVRPLATPRDAHTATLLPGGSVLVAGGFSGEGEPPLASAERWDPTSGAWRPAGRMTVARGGHAAALLSRDRVVVAGGWIGTHRYTATTEIYDSTSNRFVAGPSLPVAADGLAAVALEDGTVLVTGGQRSPGQGTDQAVVIRPDGSLRPVAHLLHARFKHTMVLLPTGEVLVIGGTDDDRRLLSSTEIFDPRTGRFRPGPALSEGRYKLSGSAAVLPDGRVVVAGGGAGAEVLDVRNDTSMRLAGVGPGRAAFSTVNTLGDGVLILGGYDESIRLTNLFERVTVPPAA